MSWKEVWDDARWVRHIADTQRGFEGMRLTRFDKPLAHNRKLADALYHADPLVKLRANAVNPGYFVGPSASTSVDVGVSPRPSRSAISRSCTWYRRCSSRET